MADSVWYPSVGDVLSIHDDILSEYPQTGRGVQDRGDIEFALQYIDDETFGTVPETNHETAFHLLRLLVANHPFVDANKRTALNTTAVFYFLTGYRFEYDAEVRSILKQFGVDQAGVDESETVAYLQSHTVEIDLPGEIEAWRDALVQYGLDELTGEPSDPEIHRPRTDTSDMATEEGADSASPLDEVMNDIREEHVRRVAAADREENRDIYDALEDE
jgi:death-on-curing protein